MIYATRLENDIQTMNKNNKAIRRGHEAGRLLLEYGLKKEYGIELEDCEILKNEHGKPYLREHPEVFFNISHCENIAVCTFGKSEVGIDVETKRKCKDNLIKRVLSEDEYGVFEEKKLDENEQAMEFIKYWTLKEAYGKAMGKGMLYDYRNTTFSTGEKGVTCPDEEYSVWQTLIDEETVVSVCRRQKESFEEEIKWMEVR